MCEILTSYNPLAESESLNAITAHIDLRYTLDRLLKNINLINRGQNAKEIFVSNTTLFQVAVKEYGDATYWTFLADVNNLLDPTIGSSITLLIPPKPSGTVRLGEDG